MTHFTAGLVVSACFLAITVLMFAKARARAWGIAPLLLTVVVLLSTFVGAPSPSDVGTVEAMALVETKAGIRIAAIDVVEHFDLLSLLPSRGGGGGGSWKERRLKLFDFADGKLLQQQSFEATDTPSPVLFGDIGGFVALGRPGNVRLLEPSTGKEEGGLEVLMPQLAASNPSVGKVTRIRREGSGCLQVESERFTLRLEPRQLGATEVSHCRAEAGTGALEASFLTLSEVPQEVPAGATLKSSARQLGLFLTQGGKSVRVDLKRLEFPRFAADSRTGQPILVSEALLLHQAPDLMATALTPSGEVVWDAALPAGLFELTMLNGQLVALGAEGHGRVIDVASGKIVRELNLH